MKSMENFEVDDMFMNNIKDFGRYLRLFDYNRNWWRNMWKEM